MTIQIIEPRYRDMTVLIACWRLEHDGYDSLIEIMRGPRKGKYVTSYSDIMGSKIETLRTRSGKRMLVRAVPLAKLTNIED